MDRNLKKIIFQMDLSELQILPPAKQILKNCIHYFSIDESFFSEENFYLSKHLKIQLKTLANADLKEYFLFSKNTLIPLSELDAYRPAFSQKKYNAYGA